MHNNGIKLSIAKGLTLAAGLVGVATLSACAGISNFNSWAAEDAVPARHVAVFAPADSNADARRLERFYCHHIVESNPNMSCEVMTTNFKVGQEITEDDLQQALASVDATHLVTIQMLSSTPRTHTSGTVIGDFVWGHNRHSEENLHQVQMLELATNEVTYSAQLNSNTAAAMTRGNYLDDFARRIVRDQQQQGSLLALRTTRR